MESVKLSSIAPKKSKLALAVSKVLHLRSSSRIDLDEGVVKVKSQETFNDNEVDSKIPVSKTLDKWLETDSLGVEALVAKLFASISSAKSAYAQLQYAQSPYDVDGIRAADRLVVSELTKLSELKRCYVKRQFDPSPGTALLSAELEEQKSILKTYKIMGKKLESESRLKESEIMYLKEKLEESKRLNQSLEKRLNRSGQIYVLDNVQQSGLSPSHFAAVVQFTVKSVRSFVKVLINEMKVAGWDLDAAANAILPGVAYWRADDKCFAFEAFVCREMFDAFHIPNFGLSLIIEKKNLQQLFYRRFTELKSMKVKDYLSQNPKSTFAKFFKAKYLQLIHPQMEASFFGDLGIRTALMNAAEIPENCTFLTSFAEMVKQVWLLHCLAFSMEPEASIFEVSKGCRFSEVYMESVAEEGLLLANKDPGVAFTVVPGFRIGKTIIQCQVYLSQPHQTKLNRRC